MDARAITWPVTPVIPDRVVSGERITSAHENTSVQCLADLWTDLQAVGAVSISDPSSVKGDLLVRDSAALNRLPVGANGTMLVADSGQFLGVRWATVSAASLGAVPTTRRVNAGAGLGGGGDLSADVTLTANVLSVNGRVGAVVLNSSDIAAAGGVPATRQILAGTGLTGGGDLTADRTLAVVDDTSTQRVRASKAGVFVAARREVNFTATGTAAVAVTDNGGANRVDVAITGSGILDPTAATGDLLVRNSGGVLTRIGVGTDGQVLAADSTATPLGVKWATPISGGMTDPTTTRGDLIARGASAPAARLPVGTDGQVLTADGSQSLGVKWASANQTPWTSDIDAASHKLNNAFAIGVGQAASSEGISVTTTSASGLTCYGSAPTSNGAITLVNGSAITGFLSQNSASGHADAALDNALVLRGANQGVIVQNNFGSIRIDSIGNLLFGDSISTFAEKLRVVRTSGQVGIGKTPAYALDVAGDCNVTGAFRVNGVAIGAGSQTPWTSNIDAASHSLNNISTMTFNPGTVLAFAATTIYGTASAYGTAQTSSISYPTDATNGNGSVYANAGSIVIAAQNLTWGGPTVSPGARIVLEGGKSPNGNLAPGHLILNPTISSVGTYGNVGIHEPAPMYPLDIWMPQVAGADGQYAININRTYDALGDWTGIRFGGGPGATNGTAGIRVVIPAGAVGGLAFHAQNNNDGSNNEIMRIDGRGLVTIGSSVSKGLLTVVPQVNPNSVVTATEIVIGDKDNSAGYGLQLGYFVYNLTTWTGCIQSLVANAGGPLVLNPNGGTVGVGGPSPDSSEGQRFYVIGRSMFGDASEPYAISLRYAAANPTYKYYLGVNASGIFQVSNSSGISVATIDSGGSFVANGNLVGIGNVQTFTGKFYGPNNMTGNPAVLHVTEQTVMSANQPNQSISFNINTSGNQVYIFVKYANGSTKTGVINIS